MQASLVCRRLVAPALLALCGSAFAATDPVVAQIKEQVQALATDPKPATARDAASLNPAVTTFYELRKYRPIWTRTDRINGLIAALKTLESDGLDPADYGIRSLELELSMVAGDPKREAAFDIRATRAGLLARSHLYRGKVYPEALDRQWNLAPRPADDKATLRTLNDAIEGGRFAQIFDAARPRNQNYAGLRAALKELREVAAKGGWPQISGGKVLKVGDADARVPTLRKRLALAGYLPTADKSDRYDAALTAAVKRFQVEQYLDADGTLGPATRRALNVPLKSRIAQLRVNLERARWMLPHLSGNFVLVDVAGYRLHYYRDSQPVWTSRVQVGRNVRRTPIFQARISYLTLNPMWTIPPTVLVEDIVPKVRRDRGFLVRNRIHIVDENGGELGADAVDWSDPEGPKNIWLRQDPGPGNSLGMIRINFPNPHDVYLHDTPHQRLFEAEQRTFSSGCIRVEQPLDLAVLLLDDPQKWSRPALEQIVGEGKTREIGLRKMVPILVLYWTVDLHDNGRVAFKPDVYELDAPTQRALDQRV